MLVICEESDDRDIGIRIEGKIGRSDYDEAIARIEKAIAEHGEVRLLVHLQSLGTMEFGAFWDDLRFSLKHINDFERVAFVGSAKWHKLVLEVVRHLTPSRSRYFPANELDEAWEWLKAREPATTG